MSKLHITVKGDTLNKISRKYGVSIRELQNINNLPDPNKLNIGQKIMLRKEDVLGFQALFLDRERNPIKGLPYHFEFMSMIIKGVTGADGLTERIMTSSPRDDVRILIMRFDNTLKQVATVMSGYGNKLVTLVSPSVKIEAQTEKHPDMKPGLLPDKKENINPIYDPKTKQPPTTNKKNFGITATPTKTANGLPTIKVEGDIPDISFLGEYVGGEITKQDIELAAQELKCDASLIYAIARQESGHSSFIKIGDCIVPAILYERHWFRKLTKPTKSTPSPYEEKYRDICGPAYHKTTRQKAGEKTVLIDVMTGDIAQPDDIYGPPALPQYKRLVKAYRLNKSAALKSCSWGKFQIMGFNYKIAGYSDVFAFVNGMCSGEPAHIKAFLKLAKNSAVLLEGLRTKNYEKIAEGHNGKDWKNINKEYASNIEKFSKEYK